MSFSAIADARNAITRLQDVFEAELVTETLTPDPELPNAVEVTNASFTWDVTPQDAADSDGGLQKSGEKSIDGGQLAVVPDTSAEDDTTDAPAKGDQPFMVKNVDMTVQRGQLVAIVGSVGSGKTSLLQGLIGEMRKTSGTVKFGGSVAYCGQSAWIQNATVRENVCFGRPFEPERYWKAVKDACLDADLDMLPNGDMTEVGEKGISLSGGQKQRLNICRAIYADCDVLIFDDPLSALDAHVGASVFKNVLLTAPAGKTRILVTHALHFLPQVDYIYTLVDGRIAERGTYSELLETHNGAFARFINEFVRKEEAEKKGDKSVENVEEEEDAEAEKARRTKVKGAQLMQAEERSTGSLDWSVYKIYSKAGNGVVFMPVLFAVLVIQQGTQVMSSYWCVPVCLVLGKITPNWSSMMLCTPRLVYWEERSVRCTLGCSQLDLFFF